MTKTAEVGKTIPLSGAAQTLQVSWNKMFNLILTGKVLATRDQNGRWQVDRSDLERLRQERAATDK